MESVDGALVAYYAMGIGAVAVTAIVVGLLSRKHGWVVPRAFLVGLLGLTAYLVVAQVLKLNTLHVFVDGAHWLELVESMRTTGQPLTPSHALALPGTENYFSVHFVPLVYVFGFIYAYFARPEALFVFGVLAMLSACYPVYYLAQRLTGSAKTALVFAVLLAWYPTFQYIALYEFEMLRFSIPILLWMFYFFEERRWRWMFAFAVLAVLVREEVGLTVAMFGVYAALFTRERWRGAVLVALGAIGFAMIASVVMPALRGGDYVHVAGSLFAQFGSTPMEVLVGALSHPLLVARAAMDTVKLANVAMLFVPLAGLPFAAPAALVGLLANLGTGLVSEAGVHSSYILYYMAPSVPFVFYAALKAWDRVARRLGAHALEAALLASVLMSQVWFGPSPLSLQFWFTDIAPAPFRTQDFHWSVYRPTAHHRLARQLAANIPNDAVVSTQQFLAPLLAAKAGVMVYPQLTSRDGSVQADFVWLDTSNNGLNPESPAFVSADDMASVDGSSEWRRVWGEGAYVLYERR